MGRGIAVVLGLAALWMSGPASASLAVDAIVDASVCFDASGGAGVAYDAAAAACNAGAGSGAFRWSLATQEGGDSLGLTLRAIAAADAASGTLSTPDSGIYQAGRVDLEFSIAVDVPDGAAWEIDFAHALLGLSALRSDTAQNLPGSSSFAASSVLGAVTAPCAFTVSPAGLGGFGTGSIEVSGGATCPAWWSGVGDAVLVLPVAFTLEARSVASEAAFLLGLDDPMPVAGVTADDYASWGRSPANDGYTATLTLRVLPEPACAPLLFASLVGLAVRERQARRA